MKLKALVYTTNYKNRHLDLTYNVLNHIATYPMDIDLVITSTDRIDLSKYKNLYNKIDQNIYTPEYGGALAMQHRDHMIARADDYDLFIYLEDDIIIPWHSIEMYLELTEEIPNDHIIGYLRYEIGPDGKKYIPDQCGQNRVVARNLEVNGNTYFKLKNLHQGVFTLTKEQLKRCIATKNFKGFLGIDSYETRGGYGIPEAASSDVFTCGAFPHKIYPHKNFDKLLIHHSANKFINMYLEGTYPWTKAWSDLADEIGIVVNE